MNYYDRIQFTASFIKDKISTTPKIGIILGTGLGGLIDILEKEVSINYADIPNFPVSTVIGHKGALVFGKLHGKDVMLMAGRFHYYEGYSMEQVTFPVRVMRALGIESLILSNAAGGMNKDFSVGDLMIINDHVNLFPEHPLRGHNDDRLGTRFPDMSEPYDKHFIETAKTIAKQLNINVKTGVYAGLQGPTFETPAEYRWLHIIGCDAVGMSTVPETIVAKHGGMKVFAMSVITDIWNPDTPISVSHEEVLEAANHAAPKMANLVSELVKII